VRDWLRDLAECGVALTGAAAVRLYDDHVDAVHALIARRVGPVLSPDLTAEAFEHALGIWDRFDRQRGSERLFLFGAGVAVIRKYPAAERAHLCGLKMPTIVSAPVDDPLVTRAQERRARSVAPRETEARGGHTSDAHSMPPSSDAGSGAVDTTPDDLMQAMRAVAELAGDDRDILLLSLWEGCSQAEIGEALGLPVGTVRSSLGRIRRELKMAINDDAREQMQ
jgi:RNA polymerase sigma factor (sigma-70 family)